jgi:tetratricopeptide (TPR) repeat protein
MSTVTPILPEPLKRAAVALQTGGDLTSAAKLCEDIQAEHDPTDATYFDALYLLAALQFRSGRLIEALASYDEALTIRPHFPEALINRAKVLCALKRFDDAVSDYDQALSLRPDAAEAHLNRANALMQMRRFEEALASYDKTLAIKPDDAIALNNRGSALNTLRRSNEAVMNYDKALMIKPDFVAALNNRGIALAALQRFEEALASCNQSLAVQPDDAWALTTRGKILHALGRFEEAVASYNKVLATQPGRAETQYHRAHALTELGRLEDALVSCNAALASRPDFAEAFNQRGVIQSELHHFPEALASFTNAQKLRPAFGDAYRNEVRLHLLVGDFRSAWRKRDELSKRASAAVSTRFPTPSWDGLEPLYGRTILLHGDSIGGEAFGDAIQFCRYVPLLAARGAQVVLEVERPLCKLVASITGVTQVTTPDDNTATAFEHHIPFSSLPWAFGTRLETIPAAIPYLQAQTEAAAEWDTRLGTRTRPRVGVVWTSDSPRENKRSSSIPLAALLPLLGAEATFVCAQRIISGTDQLVLQAQPEILNFGDTLNDFSEAAALISCLDLVISVDSCMAHLAGALGKPVWVLLCHTPDWRWLLDRDDSPWYPTARLFRQRRQDDLDEVVARVAVELQKFVDRSGVNASPARDSRSLHTSRE